MYYTAKQVRQKKHGNLPTILSRWYASDPVGRKDIMFTSQQKQPLNQTTRLCSSEKRLQTIARRAPGKDSARLQNHPSQSKSSTEKNNSSKESKNSTTRLTLKQAGGSTMSRGETCRRLRHRRQTGIKPSGRRAIGILSILQGLTICELFLNYDQFRLLGSDKKFEQYTHKYSTYKTAWSHFITRGSRGGRFGIAHLCVHNNCHPRVMSPSLPHVTQSTITSSLVHLSDDLSKNAHDFRHTMNIYPAMFHGSVADQHKSHLTQLLSPSSREKLSLTWILGQIRIKYRKDLKVWMNLEKSVQRRPTSSRRCIPITTQRRHCRFKSWRWRISKNASFTTEKCRV